MRWISVKDRLPEENQEVLCFFSRIAIIADNRWIAPQRVLRYARFVKSQPLAFIDDYYKYSDVIWWMPLPKPPKY